MRTTLKILKWLVTAVVFFIALALLINAFDEDIKPEAAAFAQLTPPQFDEKYNAYFYAAGFSAPEGKDPHAEGKRIIAEYEVAFVKNPLLPFSTDSSRADRELKIKGDLSCVCIPDKTPCMAEYVKHKAEIEKMLADNATLVQRYHTLTNYPHLIETATPAVVTLTPYSFMEVHRLVDAQIALDIMRGNTTETLDALEQNIRFGRMLLLESRSLISKMIAVAFLRRDFHLLGELMALHKELALTHHEQLAHMATPLTADEMNIGEAFRYEFAMFISIFHQTSEKPMLAPDSSPESDRSILNYLLRHFYKTNATINHYYPIPRSYAELAAMPASRFAAEKERLNQQFSDQLDVSLKSPDCILFTTPSGNYWRL